MNYVNTGSILHLKGKCLSLGTLVSNGQVWTWGEQMTDSKSGRVFLGKFHHTSAKMWAKSGLVGPNSESAELYPSLNCKSELSSVHIPMDIWRKTNANYKLGTVFLAECIFQPLQPMQPCETTSLESRHLEGRGHPCTNNQNLNQQQNHSFKKAGRRGFWRTDLGINPEERVGVMWNTCRAERKGSRNKKPPEREQDVEEEKKTHLWKCHFLPVKQTPPSLQWPRQPTCDHN